MKLTGIERRGDVVAMVQTEVLRNVVAVRAAGVVALDEAGAFVEGDVVALASPETCFHVSTTLSSDFTLPNPTRYGAIVGVKSLRPGGPRQSVCVHRDGSRVDVGIVNRSEVEKRMADLAERLGHPVLYAVNPVAAWLRIAQESSTKIGTLPDVVIDEWGNHANLFLFDAARTLLGSNAEVLPGESQIERTRAALTVLTPVINSRSISSLILNSYENTDSSLFLAALAPLGLNITASQCAQPWFGALGAVLVATAPTHVFEEVA